MRVDKELYNKLIDKSKQIKYDNKTFNNLEELARYMQSQIKGEKNEWGDNKPRNSKEVSKSKQIRAREH